MDAEHRHDLKTNELADWIGHLPEMIKKNANMIIGITLIAVGIFTWPIFNKMSQKKDLAEQTQMTQSIQMLEKDVYDVINAPADAPQVQTEALNSMLINADALLDKASETDNSNLAALARIKAAQAIRTQLHLQKEVEAETLETQIQKAKDAYQKAFETADTATLKAMAQLGLGLCSEELGQTAQAAEIYLQIIADESYAATVLPGLAQKRLDGLEENAEVFNFVKVPVEAAPAVPQEITATPAETAAVEEPTKAPENAVNAEEQTPAATEQ